MDRKHTTRLTSSGVRELLFCSSGLSFLNNNTMELTDNDRQRIRQYALSQFPDMDDVSHCSRNYGCVIGAEYATRYEREQQAELRNKVIEEVEQYCNGLVQLANWWSDDPDLVKHIEGGTAAVNRIVAFLNSLKTK